MLMKSRDSGRKQGRTITKGEHPDRLRGQIGAALRTDDGMAEWPPASGRIHPGPDTQKERDAAQNNLGRVIEDYRKRFSSFAPSAPESYSREIGRVIQTLLPAWLQFRNTFVPIKKKEKEAPAS